jgi:dolichyl-phosphate beta-glucosyltransferase
MTLSIIIPAFNEEDRLPKTLESIREFFAQDRQNLSLRELIVVDDGSTDGTSTIAEQWKNRLPIQIIRLHKNQGKGAALRAGVMAASSDLVLLYDADGATPIQEVQRLYHVLHDERTDIVIGSRVLDRCHSLITMQWHRRMIGRMYHFLTLPLIPGIQDAACGCKLFRLPVARTLFCLQRFNRFACDIEILALALRLHFRLKEVAVEWHAVPVSKVRLFRDGAEMMLRVLQLYFRVFFSQRCQQTSGIDTSGNFPDGMLHL